MMLKRHSYSPTFYLCTIPLFTACTYPSVATNQRSIEEGRRLPINTYMTTTTTLCTADENGFYGTSTDIPVNLLYRYELVYKEAMGTTFADLNPLLEKAFTNIMLPDLFPEVCSENIFRLEDAPSSTIEGISAEPVDQVIENEPCTTQVAENRTCVVVSGYETVYLNKENDQLSSSITDLFRLTLIESMNSGVYSAVHPDIETVRYVSLGTEKGLMNPNKKGGSTINSFLSAGPAIWYLVGGLAFLSLILVVVVIRAVRNREYYYGSDEEDSDDSDSDEEYEGEDEESDGQSQSESLTGYIGTKYSA